jgi:hypothetical protein
MSSLSVPATITASVLCLLGLATACGGRVILENENGGAGGTSGTQGTQTGNTTGNTTAIGTTAPSSSVSGQSGVTTSGTVSPVGSVSTVGVTTGASTGSGSNVQVFCNGQPCNPGEVCCFNPNGPGDHCGQNGQCDPGYVELACNGPNDCPGQICCAHFDPMAQQYTGIACADQCQAQGDIVVCSQMQPNVCPPGTQCHQSMQLGQGYRVCF